MTTGLERLEPQVCYLFLFLRLFLILFLNRIYILDTRMKKRPKRRRPSFGPLCKSLISFLVIITNNFSSYLWCTTPKRDGVVFVCFRESRTSYPPLRMWHPPHNRTRCGSQHQKQRGAKEEAGGMFIFFNFRSNLQLGYVYGTEITSTSHQHQHTRADPFLRPCQWQPEPAWHGHWHMIVFYR
jgi:hypothetical protein